MEEGPHTGREGDAGEPCGTGTDEASERRYPKWHWVGADPDDDSEDGRFRRRLAALAREVMLAHGADEEALPPVERTRRSGSSGTNGGPPGSRPGSPRGTALDARDTTIAAIEAAARAVRRVLGRGATMNSVAADRLLLALARSPTGATTGALVRTVGAPPSTVSTLVGSLEDEGLVERRPLPSDRRRRLAVATPSGLKQAERVAARWRHADERLLGGLSSYERDELARLLRRAAAALGG